MPSSAVRSAAVSAQLSSGAVGDHPIFNLVSDQANHAIAAMTFSHNKTFVKPSRSTSISFEFFPPKTGAGADKLWDTISQLLIWQPKFVSITCGAGGSAIDGTFAVVRHVREKIGINVAPHIAISRQSRARLREALQAYKNLGVRHVVAIRGDASQTGQEISTDDLYGSTIDFVADLSKNFGLEAIVAAYPDSHPLAPSPQHDLDYLRRKAEAGSQRAVSQFFFDPETFLRFRDRVQKASINVSLTPGIMPIHNLAQVLKFAQGCGTLIPSGFASRFERWGLDQAALFNEGVAHASALCDDLRREGVQDFHFYTLNRSEMTYAICERLGLNRADAAAEASN